jgi:hypothetical protein
MIRNVTPRATGALLLGLALTLAGAANADSKKMVVVRPLKAGASATYKATVKANVMGTDAVIERTQKQTIKEIKENGNVVILAEDLGGTMKLGAQEEKQPAGPPTTETRDKLGKLLSLTQDQQEASPFTPEIQKLIATVSDLILTEKEIGEGDNWETMLDNPASKDNKVKVTTTYQGTDKVDSVDLLKFKQVAEAVVNADGSKMVTEMTIWVNPKDGLLEKVDGKTKDVPTQFGPIEFTLALQRTKAAAAVAEKQ